MNIILFLSKKKSTVPKHVHLPWMILKDSLPDKKKLIQKCMLFDPFYPRCKSGDEDLDHIFMNCWYAKQAWLLSPLGIRFEGISCLSLIGWKTLSPKPPLML